MMAKFLSEELKEGMYVRLKNGEIRGPIKRYRDSLSYWSSGDGLSLISWGRAGNYTHWAHMLDIVAIVSTINKEAKMNTLIQNKSYVIVRFKDWSGNAFSKSTKTYTYIAEGTKDELEQFNYAIVDAPSSGYTVVQVEGIENLDLSSYKGEYKHVVATFSDEGYRKQRDSRIRKAAIEKELRQRAAERQKQKEIEELLDGDEEAMKLYEEYKNL